MQTNGNGDLSAAADEAEREPSARRVWFAEGQQHATANDNVPSRTAAGMNGERSGHELADVEPGSDGMEPAQAADGKERSARARWGKAVKTVVATDTVQVVPGKKKSIRMLINAGDVGS